MKRFIITLLMISVVGVGLFAEDITLKGKLTTNNRRHPELASGSEVYFLMIPRMVLKDLKDGEEVSVTGEKTECVRVNNFFSDTEINNLYFRVKSITAKGKTLDVEKYFNEKMSKKYRRPNYGVNESRDTKKSSDSIKNYYGKRPQAMKNYGKKYNK